MSETTYPESPAASADETLVEAAKTSAPEDFRAFEALVERHKGVVLANCRHLTGCSDECEDLAQEVFVKAYFGLRRFEGRSKFRTWLQRIKINHCLNHLRSRRGKHMIEIDEVVTRAAPQLQVEPKAEERLQRLTQKQRVHRVLSMLPDTLRVPLVMCDMDGMAYKEIAETLGIGLSATKMRIKRARDEFRELFRSISEPPASAAPVGQEAGS